MLRSEVTSRHCQCDGARHQAVLAFGDATPRPVYDALPLPPKPGPPLDGAGRRDRALAAVMRSGFLGDALRLLPGLLIPGECLLGEEIRARLERHGLIAPRPGCWGALIMQLIRRGIVRPSGEWVASRRPKAHARKAPMLRVCGEGWR